MGVIRLLALTLFTSVTVAFAYAGRARFIMGRPRDGFRPDPVYRRLGNQELNSGMNRAKVRSGCEYFSMSRTMHQMMDHFNESDKRTWQQKYYLNTTFYKAGSPIFLMLGGEGPESGYFSNCQDVPFVAWAMNLTAAVYSLEHRFYGSSRPFETQTTDNLKYLSSKQAIEDAAFFIRYINQREKYNDPKWIVFGGSYSGALAAWMREKHPELVAGAVGSSGPVEPILDFYQYLEVVENSLAAESPSCASAVQTAFSDMSNLVWTPTGRKNLSDTFKLEPRLDQTKLRYKDIQNFFSSMYGYFQGAVQYSGDNIGSHAYGGGIPQVCKIMNNDSLNCLERVQEAAVYLTEYSGEENFTVTGIDYDAMITELQNVTYDKSGYESASRSWTWQTCTEFGYFQTTDLGRNIFGSVTPSNLFIDMCTDIFGPAFTVASISQSIHHTEKYYGGRDHFKGTNVVLPNGDVDPWHALGLYSNIEPSVVPILMHGTAHCADMYPPSPRDPPSLTAARKLIKANIDAWVSGRPGHRAATQPAQVNQQSPLRAPKPFVSSLHSIPLRPFAEEMKAVESVPKHLTKFFRGRPLQGMLQDPPMPSTLTSYPEGFIAGNITMPVDHFDATNTNRFNQRFWMNPQYAIPGGPHFLMIGGEGTANVKWVTNPDVIIMRAAKKFSATVYMLEHRYYGESWPTPDQSTKNLKWLTSEQALADLAQFINTMNNQYNIKNPHWVTFGGSYPGMLSAWFRQFYPELTIGALASSAPINAKVDFYEYLMVVQNALTVFNPTCADRTRQGFEEMHKLVMTPQGRVTLSDLFTLKPAWSLTSQVTELDVENLFSTIYGNFQGAVQYNNDNSGIHATGGGVREVCERMLNMTRTPLQAVADVNVYIADYASNGFTYTSNRYMDYIDYLRNVNGKTSSRSWTYQTCNEFGFFQSTDIGANIFGSPTPVNIFIDTCQDAFGPEFTPKRVYDLVHKSSKFYGGSDYYRGSNVLFTNGNIDPWHALSKYDGTGSVKTILMNGTAHCAELYPPRAQDAPDLATTRALVDEMITLWLKEAMNPSNSGPAMATYPTAMCLLYLAYLMLAHS